MEVVFEAEHPIPTSEPMEVLSAAEQQGICGNSELGKRKREEGREEKSDPPIVEVDDPLFATRTKKRQRTVEKAKKVNGIVKKITKKEALSTEAFDDPGARQDPEAKARRYQLEVLREAQKKNTIVYLETGCGKTLIAVLLMRSLAARFRVPERKKVAVFLVPTVHLVMQQSGVINLHTDLRLGAYYGSLGVDTWKPERWLVEIDSHEVLVMTPQIFLDLLTHGIVKFDIVELLIFDECHHAHKKHAYSKIMDRYRDTPAESRPKVFGMTASPVIRKGVSSGADCEMQLARLEQKLDAKVFAVKDRSELESYVPTPNTQGKNYDCPSFCVEEYKAKLLAIAEKYQKHEILVEDTDEKFKDYEELVKKLQKSITRRYNALLYCLVELGLWSACKAAELLLKNDFKDSQDWEPNLDVVDILKNAKESFLREALDVLQPGLPSDPCSSQGDMPTAIEKGLLTPKVNLLTEVLMSYSGVQEIRCIVFVDRVVAALVIATLINKLSWLSFLHCDYLAGINGALDPISRKSQQQVIQNFRLGKLNILVATNVAEEGLDVQGCHSVIRFDICKTVRSYIQSRGRARRPGSDYIVFMERGNDKQKEEFDKIVQSESRMIESALDRDLSNPEIHPTVAAAVESFQVETTGATLTTDSSVSFLYRFCSKLPGDKYYTPRPEFSCSEEPDKMHVCVLRLPPNAPIHELTGPVRRTPLLAKQAVCLQACRILHAMGAITDYLLPIVDDGKVDEDDIMNMKTTKNQGAGTTKQKELHSTVVTSKLRGSWDTGNQVESLHAYKVLFFPPPDDETVYGSFAFLVETKLDDDVATLQVDLGLKLGKMGRAEFHPAGVVHLTSEQIGDAKEYQELFFNGMFSKLLTRSGNGSGSLTAHKSLMIASDEDKSRIWEKNKMYLLLPLVQISETATKETYSKEESPHTGDLEIDWKGVSSTAEAGRLFRSFYEEGSGVNPSSGCDTLDNIAPTYCQEEADHLQLAFGAHTRASDIVDTVVLTVHTGMIYCVTKVLYDINAMSPFPDIKDGEGQKFSSYGDYFRQKHRHILRHTHQPMLQAKQTHKPRNLLARNSVIGKGKKKQKGASQEVEACYIELPPELCMVLGVSDSILRSVYLLPSVMHRLYAALMASQLRQVIKDEFPHPNIPVMRIVESLTTLRCLEEFSLEGLELLGDSFLKYAWSKNLFLTHDKKHEGQLSARRCREICNAKLHNLALKRDLPTYIRDEVFDPSRWVPPGLECPKVLLCRCNLANLCHSKMDNIEGKDATKQSTKVVKIGKSCAQGHRWLCSKTISDVVEALIGAYLVESDDAGALNFMTWVGMKVQVDPSLVEKSKSNSVLDSTINIGADLQGLERRLNYNFTNKALLVEAITHASHQEVKGGFCYQRLEFLGDAVLDYLITKHLYFSHPGLTPGRLTDLRSAAVNNECFARIAVKHCFNKYLRHGSGFLLKQIEEFVNVIDESKAEQKSSCFGWDGVKGPKVLGDLVESIAGAILVDTGFNLDTVWTVLKPLLSPIVTPETLPLHPVRELQELCHLKDYNMVLLVEQEVKMSRVTIDVDTGSKVLSATSLQMQKRTAQKDAAQKMLSLLQSEGAFHPCNATTLYERSAKQTTPDKPSAPAVPEPAAHCLKRKLEESEADRSAPDAAETSQGKKSKQREPHLLPPSVQTSQETATLPTTNVEISLDICADSLANMACSTTALLSEDHKKRGVEPDVVPA